MAFLGIWYSSRSVKFVNIVLRFMLGHQAIKLDSVGCSSMRAGKVLTFG